MRNAVRKTRPTTSSVSGRVRHERPCGAARPEAGEQDARQQVQEHRIHERRRHADLAAVEEHVRDAEARAARAGPGAGAGAGGASPRTARGTACRAGSTRTARSACARTRPDSRAPSSTPPDHPTTARAPPRCGRPRAPAPLRGQRGRSSPASVRRPSCTRSGRAVRHGGPPGPCRRGSRFARRRSRCARRSAAALSPTGGARGPPRLRPRAESRGPAGRRDERQRRGEAQSRESSMRKLHILFPMKLSGVATMIEIACAAARPRPPRSRAARARRRRTRTPPR